MESTNQVLSITTLNCRGVIGNCGYVDQLLSQCDIMCLQEHHLFDDNINFLSTLNPNFEQISICSSFVSDSGIRIRKGGLSIMWSRSINMQVRPLQLESKDIQIVELMQNNGACNSAFIMNVYLPAENHGYLPFEESLTSLMCLYHNYSQYGAVIICGDFNANILSGNWSLLHSSSDPRRSNALQRFLTDTNQISLVTNDVCKGPLETLYPGNGGPGTQVDHIVLEQSRLCHVTCRVRSLRNN